jgi:hypothetical protein
VCGSVPKIAWLRHEMLMTLLWLLIWFLAGHEPLGLNPVNAWGATLVLAVALDLSARNGLARGK